MKKLIGLIAAGLALLCMGQASQLPNGMQTYVDLNGVPLTGGSVCFYIPSTLTPKQTWQDAGETVANTSPCVTLDSAGRAVVYGSGEFRQILKDQFGNTIWDQVTWGTTGLPNVTTIAALEALQPNSVSSVVIVLGYNLTGDGGGGTLYWNSTSTATANGCTVFAANGVPTGRWIRPPQQTLNVLQCGADSTGATDSTAAFTNAISSRVSATIDVPYGIGGTYKVTAGSITLPSQYTLRGVGIQSAVIKSFSTSGAILTLGNAGSLSQYITVTNLVVEFDSSVKQMSGQYAIEAIFAANVYIDHVFMQYANVNLELSQTLDVYVDYCQILSGATNVSIDPGVNELASNRIFIQHSTISNAAAYAIRAIASGSNTLNNIVITDDDIEGNNQGLNAIDVIDMRGFGKITFNQPGLTFERNWMESQAGGNDAIYVLAGNADTSFSFRDNLILEPNVTHAALEIDGGGTTAQAVIDGNGINSAGPTYNLAIDSNITGYAYANLIPRLLNAGTMVFNPAGGHSQTNITMGLAPPASTATFTMAGLGATVPIQRSGVLDVKISGYINDVSDTTAGRGIVYQIYYGTGMAPANGAALTGTAVGVIYINTTLAAPAAAADVSLPLAATVQIPGLGIGTTYWVDLAQKAVGAANQYGIATASVALNEE